MKKTLNAFCILSLVALLANTTVYCQGEPNAWNGTWKLNHAKSELSGPTFIITISPEGEFQMTTANLSYKFYCDGKYRPLIGHRSLACLKTSKTSLDISEKEDERLVGTVHRELSPDGKGLTQITTRVNQKRPQAPVKKMFVRFSKSTGFAGAWKDINELDGPPQIMVTMLANSTLRLSFPREKQYTDAKLDGSDAPTHGIANGARITLSVTPEEPQKLLTLQKLNGVVLNAGNLILSSDGRSITEETWKPDAPKVKSRLVYEKQ
jgi:hypothetical protein